MDQPMEVSPPKRRVRGGAKKGKEQAAAHGGELAVNTPKETPVEPSSPPAAASKKIHRPTKAPTTPADQKPDIDQPSSAATQEVPDLPAKRKPGRPPKVQKPVEAANNAKPTIGEDGIDEDKPFITELLQLHARLIPLPLDEVRSVARKHCTAYLSNSEAGEKTGSELRREILKKLQDKHPEVEDICPPGAKAAYRAVMQPVIEDCANGVEPEPEEEKKTSKKEPTKKAPNSPKPRKPVASENNADDADNGTTADSAAVAPPPRPRKAARVEKRGEDAVAAESAPMQTTDRATIQAVLQRMDLLEQATRDMRQAVASLAGPVQ